MWIVARYDGFERWACDNPIVGLFESKKQALKALVTMSYKVWQNAHQNNIPQEEISYFGAYEIQPGKHYGDCEQVPYMDGNKPEELKDLAKAVCEEGAELEELEALIEKLRGVISEDFL